MNDLKEIREFFRNYPKLKADKNAFYLIFKKDGIYFVTMYFSIDNIRSDVKNYSCKVYSYQHLLRMCGTGQTLFFHNFYLS